MYSPKQKDLFNILIIFFPLFIAGILGYLGSKGVFDRKAIDQKYCYYFNPNDTIEGQFEKVYICYSKKNIAKTYNYYSFLLQFEYDSAFKYFNTLQLNQIYPLPKNKLIDILKYSEDSTYAKVRAEWEDNYRPFHFKEVGLVPTFLLHDTLPKMIKDN